LELLSRPASALRPAELYVGLTENAGVEIAPLRNAAMSGKTFIRLLVVDKIIQDLPLSFRTRPSGTRK